MRKFVKIRKREVKRKAPLVTGPKTEWKEILMKFGYLDAAGACSAGADIGAAAAGAEDGATEVGAGVEDDSAGAEVLGASAGFSVQPPKIKTVRPTVKSIPESIFFKRITSSHSKLKWDLNHSLDIYRF